MSATPATTLDFTPILNRPAGSAALPVIGGHLAPLSRTAVWTGRVVTGIISLLLAMDAGLKVFLLAPAVEGTAQLGFPAHIVFPLGLIQAVSLVLYLVPRTSILGAVLWTGYLGGAVATHVRLDNPLFTHTLSPIYVAILLWGGLWLRDRRMRTIFTA